MGGVSGDGWIRMPGASRLSSIWAGRCAEEKTATQRARSPSGNQFMVLALSLPLKKQISWYVCKRLFRKNIKILSLSQSYLLTLTCLLLSISSHFIITHFPFLGCVVRRATVLSALGGALTHCYTGDVQTHTSCNLYLLSMVNAYV